MRNLPPEMQQKEHLYRRIIVFAMALIMIVLYFGKIVSTLQWLLRIILPFIIGLILAFILDVIAKGIRRFFVRFFKASPGKGLKTFSNIGAIVFVLIILGIFVVFILPQIYSSIQSIFLNLPFALNNIYQWALKATRNYPTIRGWLKEINATLFAFEADTTESSSGLFGMMASGQITNLVQSIINVLSTTLMTGLSVLITVMFSIIVLFNRETLVRELHGAMLAYLPEKSHERINKGMDIVLSTFTAYISGTCLECLILGSLIIAGCLILQLPYPFLAGVLVGACALVPMFGAFVGGVFSCLIIAIQSPMGALYFMIMFVIIQQIEGNLIYPNVVGKSVGLPPMYIIIAVTLGGNIAGILGMILLIPISSCIYQIIKEDAKARILEKEMMKQEEYPV